MVCLIGFQATYFTMTNSLPRAAFHATRLTSSTFLIKEYNDIYSEHPHIYAKLVSSANTMLIIDTGCGGASNDPDITIKSLKKFIETVRVEDNKGLPLNEGGRMSYVVALTHCHYDHIRTLNIHTMVVHL
jgi:glyoxylase-like metal-dependent hydrolase (beta-lactamase superfamily II)